MTDPSSREAEYVVVRDRKPKKSTRYYYDDDDNLDYDSDSHHGTVTRRVARRKPVAEHRIKYVTSEEPDAEYRRQHASESNERTVKVRRTTNGEQVLMDDDDNIIKVIRNTVRSPTPPMVEHRRIRIRPREPHVQYYETPDGQIVARSPRKHAVAKSRPDIVYSDEEPTRAMRRLMIDPATSEPSAYYEKEKVKKQPKKYVVRQRTVQVPVESEDDDESPHHHVQQPQYVQIVHRRAPAPQVVTKKEPPMKYVMVRRKADSEPVYAVSSNVPVVKNNRRIVYEAPAKDSNTKYVYATDGKFYK